MSVLMWGVWEVGDGVLRRGIAGNLENEIGQLLLLVLAAQEQADKDQKVCLLGHHLLHMTS